MQSRLAVVEHALRAMDAEERLAQVVAASDARRALTAGQDEGRNDAVAGPHVRHVRRHLDDGAGHLVAQHGRRRVRQLALDHVQVGVADAAGRDLDQHLALSWLGLRDVLYEKRFADAFEDRCSHGCLPVDVCSDSIAGCTIWQPDGRGRYKGGSSAARQRRGGARRRRGPPSGRQTTRP